jgi:hypothetical protein
VAGVYFAENLNRFLGENWKSFAGQNYFDQNGVFLSAVWSGPLLVIAIIILVSVNHLIKYSLTLSAASFMSNAYSNLLFSIVGKHTIFLM